MTAVSIIVPCYNHAPFLRQRMDSILNQMFQDFEIILLDDASTDGSAAILSEYQHHKKVSQFIVNKTNSGNPFIQWQKGLSLAKSDYIWIAETDDLAEPTLLGELYERLSSAPEAGLVYCQSKIIDDAGNIGISLEEQYTNVHADLWSHDFQLMAGEKPLEYLFIKNIIPNASAVLFKKSLLLSSPWIPDQFRYVGDWHAWIEISKSHNVLFCAEVLNYHRSHDSTTRIKSNTIQYVLEMYAIRKIINQYTNVNPELKERIWKVLFRKVVNAVQLKNFLFSWQGYRTLFALSVVDKKVPIRLVQYMTSVTWNEYIRTGSNEK